MRRGTTPTVTVTVAADIHDHVVHLALRVPRRRPIVLRNDRLTMTPGDGKTTIEFTLTQEETLSLCEATAEVQVRAVKNGVAIATGIGRLDVGRILEDGVIDG